MILSKRSIRSGRDERFPVPPEGGSKTPPTPSGATGGPREVIFEFIPMGGGVKATAVDVLTGIEVSVIGPAGPVGQRELERVALMKLKQRLVREGGGDAKPDTPPSGNRGGGIIV